MMTQQNTDAAPVSETRPQRNWNKWDIFFIVTPVICIILVPLGGLGYIRGRFYPLYYDFCSLYLLIGCLIVFYIVYGFVRLFVYWKNHTWKKKFIIVVEIGIPFLFITSFFISSKYVFWQPGCKPFLYGFRDRIKSKADIEAIRVWLKTLDKGDLNYYSQYSHRDELPEFVKEIGGSVGISTDRNGNPVLNCSFGGGFDHWGVEIGAEDMEIPSPDYASRAGYRMYVEPGFYIVAW